MRKIDIARDYIKGEKYKDIMSKYKVNRWNIQDALSWLAVKTNRIKSPPRLKGSKKKAGTPMERYHDGDLLPPMKVNKNNPVLEGDMDIMERMDKTDNADDIQAEGTGGYCEIEVDENNEVRYRKYD